MAEDYHVASLKGLMTLNITSYSFVAIYNVFLENTDSFVCILISATVDIVVTAST